MQVTGSAGSSAAWMLQRLFGSDGGQSSSMPAITAGGQTMPGGDSSKCNAGGASQPQMAGGTMSAMVGMQTQGPPIASDVASQLVDALDTNGDGVVSADELQKGLSAAGVTADASTAIAKIDTDGDGSISKDELTSAVQSDMDTHKAHHGGHHHKAADEASSLLSSFDTNSDGGLGLDEIMKALGKTDDANGTMQQAFASLDKDGDGTLSSVELTTAIQDSMAAQRAYAQSAAISSAA